MNNIKSSILLFVVIIPIFLIAQTPKQKVFYYYNWNFPKIKTSSTKLGITIDEKKLPTSLIVNGSEGEKILEDNIISAHTEIPVFLLNNLDFRSFRVVPINEAEIYLELVPISPSFILSTSKYKEGTPSTPIEGFSGNLDYINGINVVIKDRNGNILFNKVIKEKSSLQTIKEINQNRILNPDIALNAIRDSFLSNIKSYNLQAANAFLNGALYKVVKEIQIAIDVRQDKERFFLYSYNKKKGYELEKIKESIKSLQIINKLENTSGYQNKLKELLLPKINFWEEEAKKYNPEDKKEKKIYWGLLANVSGGYYAIGEYEKALETYEKIKIIDYKKDFTYLEELPKEKLNSKKAYLKKDNKPYKDYLNIDFRGTHNSDFIEYLNIGEQITIQNAYQTIKEYEIKKAKAKFLYKILAIKSYHEELKRLTKKFTDRGKESIGFEEKDPFYESLVFRVAQQTKELKLEDLKTFNPEEKILVTKITDNLEQMFKPIIDELEVNTNINETKDSLIDKRAEGNLDIFFENLKHQWEKIDVLYNRIGNREENAINALTKDINLLTDKVFLINSSILKKLPFLEMLTDELTSEGKLNYVDNEKLYKKIRKRYKEVYSSIFLNNAQFTKYMHHREVSKFDKTLKYYQTLYSEDVENINLKFKNTHKEQRVLDILMLFIK